jgi:hypothetical protein
MPQPSLTDAVVLVILSILTSPQMKLIAGSIFVDLGLGIARALRGGEFEWAHVANFYKTNVLPYVLGYLVLHLAISFMIPPDALGGMGAYLSPGLVNACWAVLMGALGASIGRNLQGLGLVPFVGAREISQ